MVIDPELSRAETLPSEHYTSEAKYWQQVETALLGGWHVVARRADVRAPGTVLPVTLGPGSLDEPVVLVRQTDGALAAFANVCTHRGATIVGERCEGASSLRCPYHGRLFGLDGRFRSMPEMEGVEGFPSGRDDLTRLGVAEWGPLVFVSFSPREPFEAWIAPVERRVGAMGCAAWAFDAETTYDVPSHWALYVDNFLEGFHIPWVHPALARTIDYKQYTTAVGERENVQIAIARDGEPAFDLPDGHVDADRSVAAYYFFVFPTTMLNFYPWGLSVNVVEPRGVERTAVRFWPFVRDASLRDVGAGGALDLVQREDEAIVGRVAEGIRSRAYRRGRYSVLQEACVHQFHRTLTAWVEGPPPTEPHP